MATSKELTLFIWKGRNVSIGASSGYDKIGSYGNWANPMWSICPFCSGILDDKTGKYWHIPDVNWGFKCWHKVYTCKVCGFCYEYYDDSDGETYPTINFKTLIELGLDELSLEELGSHLKRKFRDIYALNPRTFERLVADIYKNHGYYVQLTQPSRDGGVDIYLMQKEEKKHIIVQVKRYKRERKVSVNHIRELFGILIRESLKKAILVTSSGFTLPAIKEASCINVKKQGISLDLVDAGRLASMLNVYNKKLPPLEIAIPEFRQKYPSLFGERERLPYADRE